MKKTILIIAVVLGLYSCTANVRARRWGGTEKIVLEDHEVLLNATWKENELWVLTKDTISNVSHFREHSSWGVVEGEVQFK
jgi:hypothetical protein